MDVVTTFGRALDQTYEVVDLLEPGQLANPTPCTDWDVRAMINHLTAVAMMFAECVEQGSVSDARFGELMGGDDLGNDVKGRYRAASDRVRATFAMPGALDKTVRLPFGEMPAGVALSLALWDSAVHAADIAKATSQNIEDEEILTIALGIGHQLITDDHRKPGIYDAEQPAAPNASAADRLLAFAGRRV